MNLQSSLSRGNGARRSNGTRTTARKVADETFAKAKRVFSDQQIVDLTAVAGNYVMVAMLLAMAEATVPPGKEPPFGDDEQ